MSETPRTYRGKLLNNDDSAMEESNSKDWKSEPFLELEEIHQSVSSVDEIKAIHPFIQYLKNKKPKGFEGESVYSVGSYFLRAMFMENLNMRASSLSFNFFLAMFPAMMFLLTLIAYLPITGMKTQFITELSLILPKQTYKEIQTTIYEILNKQNTGLLSFGFISTLYFASNAFHLLINSFNRRLPNAKKKNWIQIRLKAIGLTFLMSALIIVGLFLIMLAYQSVRYITKHHWPFVDFYTFLIMLFEYVVVAGLFVMAISNIYFFGPSSHNRWKFFSAGSTTATVLSGLSTLIFSLYVNNFNTYNKIYGSIGAIIALMILIYINVLTIIVGFELNVSIEKAKLKSRQSREAE